MNQECYFDDPELLSRVPGLLLTLAAIYFVMGLTGALLIIQPPDDWLTLQKKADDVAMAAPNGGPSVPDEVSMTSSSNMDSTATSETVGEGGGQRPPIPAPIFVSWKKALMRREFYQLWATRLSVVLITQVRPFNHLPNVGLCFGGFFLCTGFSPNDSKI